MRAAVIIIISSLLLASSLASGQTAIKKQRVIAISRYNIRHHLHVDSIYFRYSEKRGSKFNIYTDERKYFGFNWIFHPEQASPDDVQDPFTDVYDLDVLFDTMRAYRLAPGGIYVNYESWSNNYFRDSLPIETWEKSGPRMARRLVQYNDANLVSDALFLVSKDSTLTTWDTIIKRRLGYERKHITLDESDHGQRIYKYDPNGNCTEIIYTSKGAGRPQQRDLYSFNDRGKVVSKHVIRAKFRPDEWDTTSQYLFYDDSNRLSRLSGHVPSLGKPDTMLLCTWHYGSPGVTDTVVRYGYGLNGLAHCSKTIFYYNEYGNPDSALFIGLIDCSTLVDHFLIRYSYEEYIVGYNDTINTDRLLLFPNPAANLLKIKWNSQRPGTGVYINIYSSRGEFVKQYYIRHTQPVDSLSIDGLSSAIYFVRIVTDGGGLLHTQSLLIN